MKAAVITTPGDVEVLEIREVPTPPAPVADRVRVRVHAAGLNRADILQRKGKYPPPPGYPKDIPGMEFAGEVEAIGPEVRTWRTGDRVFGITGGGAQAEFVVVPEDHLASIPKNLNWSDAAAVPEVFITAHDALFTQARVQPGEIVLIHAIGSGVGTAGAQLARVAGARVIGTSRTKSKLDRAAQFGMDHGIVVEENVLKLAEEVGNWTAGRGVNVVLDLVGAVYLHANLRSMAAQGRLILVGTTSGSKATLDFAVVMHKRLKLQGTVLRARSNEQKATATRLFNQQVVPLLESGSVRPVVDKTFDLSEIGEAHRRMESDENFGKIVLLIN